MTDHPRDGEGCLWSNSSGTSADYGVTFSQKPLPSNMVVTITSCFYLGIAIVGAFLNSVAFIALWRSNVATRKPTTSFILCLTASDLLICLVCLPVDGLTFLTGYDWASSSSHASSFGEVLPQGICTFAGLTKHTASQIAWTTLAFIAVERYCKIVAGSQAHDKFFSARSKRCMIGVLWVSWWSVSGIFGNHGYDHYWKRCTLKPPTHPWQVADRGPLTTAWMCGVLLVICWSCLSIWYKARQSSSTVLLVSMQRIRKTSFQQATSTDVTSSSSDAKQAELNSANHPHPRIQEESQMPSPATRNSKNQTIPPPFSRRDLALVKILAITTGTYLVLVAPMVILDMLDPCDKYPNLRCFVYCFYILIHVANFFIYVASNLAYRQACFDLLVKSRASLD